MCLEKIEDLPKILSWAKETVEECEACKLNANQKSLPKTGGFHASYPGQPCATGTMRIKMNLIKENGKGAERIELLIQSYVDIWSKFYQGFKIESTKPKDILRSMHKAKECAILGRNIAMDRDGGQTDEAIMNFAANYNMNIILIAGQAAWKNGVVERAHGV